MAASSMDVLENTKCSPDIASIDFEKRCSLRTTSDRGIAHQNWRRMLNFNDSLKRLTLPNTKGRTRSASLGRDEISDLKARYWAFLLENLQHAMDELYQTCGTEEYISECKLLQEVILVLENYTKKFHDLVERFGVKGKNEIIPAQSRINSLASEIEKSSPEKIPHKNYQPTLNGVACRNPLLESSKNTPIATKGNERSSPTSLNDSDESKKCVKCAPLNNQQCVERSIVDEKLSEKPATLSNEETSRTTRDAILVESWSQTDDDLAPVTAKKQLTNVGRKMTNSSNLYTKKMARSLSVSNAAETKSTSSPVSSLSTAKRFPTCVSPRKPVPGRNVAAPEFVPGKKVTTCSVKLPATIDAKARSAFCDSAAVKTKIPRSQSDPVFDTGANDSKRTGIAIEENPHLSAECVKIDRSKDSLSTSLVASVHSLRVINESAVPTNAAAVDAKIKDDCVRVKSNETGSIDDAGSAAILADKTTNAKTIASSTKLAPRTPTKNDSRPPSVTKYIVNADNVATTANTTNGEKKNDALKKNFRVVVGNGSSAAVPGAIRNRPNDGNNRVVTERRPASSLPKSRPATAQSHCPPYQANALAKHAGRTEPSSAVVPPISAKIKIEKSSSKTKTIATTKSVPSGDKEKWPSSKPRSNNNSITFAKSNSSQDGFKRYGRDESRCKMYRSKTSVDLKSANARNQTTAPHASVHSPKIENTLNKDECNVKSCENDSSPRRRRGSKDTDGWETVIGKSRRSITNSSTIAGAKTRSFDVNNRFYEPSSSTSLPILVLEDDGFGNDSAASKNKLAHRQQPQNHHQSHPHPHPHPHPHHHNQHNRRIEVKSKSALEMKSHNKNRNRNNSHGSNNSNGNRESNCASTAPSETGHSTGDGVCRAVGVEYDNYKLRKERPIISSTAMFTTFTPKKKKPNDKDNRKTKAASKENKTNANANGSKSELEDRSTGGSIKESTNGQGGDDSLDDEESLRKSEELREKEISLQNEIDELQKNADVDVDQDLDADADPDPDPEDADVEVDVDSDSTDADQEFVDLCNNNNDEARRSILEMKYEHMLTNMSWAERAMTLDKLEELLSRDPSGKWLRFANKFTTLKQLEDLVSRASGRAVELHQKLSSPSRKRISPDRTILQHKARQAKAKRNREQLLQDKSAKLRELFNKIAEVKAMQAQLANERGKLLEQKLKRAEENRKLHLKNIQEKAHDEAKKQKEIAFINELEAQNKRHDYYTLCQEQEDRLLSILEERQRRQEEKAAKEAAVVEKRKAIEAERQEKIEKLQEKMMKREERIDRELQEKERERIKMAREKARDREDRLLALQAAQIANAEELQKKIQQKQESSARRHEENIELIRQKAIEIGTPRLTPYQINKLCSVCNVVIDSEVFLLSHLKGRSHQEAVKKYREQFEASVKFNECSIITDAPADVLHEKRSREKERQNTLRKRCKKIRHRLSNRSEAYLKDILTTKDKCKKADSSNKGRILKSVKEIEKQISTQGSGVWPNNAVTILERNLFEIIRILEKRHADDQRMFREFDGFAMLSRVYNLALDLPKNMSPYLPLKCFIVASNLFAAACNRNVENCLYVLLSNNLIQILDFLLNRLNLIMPNSDDRNGMVVYKADTVADVLMNVCSNILSTITTLASKQPRPDVGNGGGDYDLQIVSAHLRDVVSYVVCTGIVDKLAVYCSSVHDNKSADSYFLLHCMELLTQLVETRRGNITNKEDCTQLMATLKATELVGAVSMLYAMLLHQDSMSNDKSSTLAVLRPDVVNVIIATLRLFSKVAELNLKFFQNILGAEGISLQVRHIISYLLRYCTQNDCCKNLLHQVIEFIGFFAIHHTDNQLILQSGSTPTVLQQLSSLPFAYFSNPVLVRILFPTLLACCVGNSQNRTILDQEVSFQLLEDFQNNQDSENIPLIKLLQVN